MEFSVGQTNATPSVRTYSLSEYRELRILGYDFSISDILWVVQFLLERGIALLS